MTVKEFFQKFDVVCNVVYFVEDRQLYPDLLGCGYSCPSLDTFFNEEEVEEMYVYSINVWNVSEIRLDIGKEK